MADAFAGIAPLAIGDRVRLDPCPATARLVFRGDHDAASRAGAGFGVALPTQPCRAATNGTRAALWLGPDEWLLLAPLDEAAAIQATIAGALATMPHSLVETSDAHAALTLSGLRAETVLAAGCALDLSTRVFPVGMCTRTLLAKATVVLWRQDETRFRIELRRSFAAYGWGFLAEAAREHRAA